MEWIEKLKQGDTVIVSMGFGFRPKIKTVEKITPAGYVKVDGSLYNKDGSRRGGEPFNSSYLREATTDAVTEILNNEIVDRAIGLMRKTPSITLEQAQKIIEILG